MLTLAADHIKRLNLFKYVWKNRLEGIRLKLGINCQAKIGSQLSKSIELVIASATLFN